MSVFSFIWRLRFYYRRALLLLIVGSLFGIVMNSAAVLPPLMLGRAIDAALAYERRQGSAEAVGWAALLFVLAVVASEGPRIGKRWGLRGTVARVLAEMRIDALTNVLRNWPIARLNREPVGGLMARIVADVDAVGQGVRELTIETWDTLWLVASLFTALMALDWRLTLLVCLPVPVGTAIGRRVGAAVRERTLAARRANGDLTAALQETLTGLRLLRLFGREDAVAERIARLADNLARANLTVNWLQGGLAPVYGFVMTAGVLALFGFGGQNVIQGGLTVGAFVAYLELYLRFIGRAPRIPQMLNALQGGAAAFKRLDSLLLTTPTRPARARWQDTIRQAYVEGPRELSESDGAEAAERPAGRVELRDICFRYPGSTDCSVNGVSLQAEPGELVAVTGPVGSGKSALARAMLGLYPLENGQVLIDGRDAASLSPGERPRYVAYLPQDGFVFSGTVEENVVLGTGRDGEDGSRLETALHTAALEQDLETFPEGAATRVGELGVRVSGGQRQRIGLARALAMGAAVLVLDDPFSAVDVATERAIIERLRRGPWRPTIFLFSHRLAAFPLADHILVLNGGRVVEQGTHEALLAADGLYAIIYRAQMRVAASPASGHSGREW